MMQRGTRRLLVTLGLMGLLAGCTTLPTPAPADADLTTRQEWSGRMALQVLSDPPESFSASFELMGNDSAGTLRLLSPFGQTLATAEWTPGMATLRQGQDVRHYPGMAALTEDLTGTPLPLQALFGWLRGNPTAVEGWQVDLSDHATGRLRAERLFPAPQARLSLVVR